MCDKVAVLHAAHGADNVIMSLYGEACDVDLQVIVEPRFAMRL